MWHKLWLEATFELPLQLRIGMRFLCLHWYRLPFNSSMPECRNIQELPSATFSALLILVVGCTILSVFFTVCATTTKFVYVPPASQPTPVFLHLGPAPSTKHRAPNSKLQTPSNGKKQEAKARAKAKGKKHRNQIARARAAKQPSKRANEQQGSSRQATCIFHELVHI